MNLNGKYAHNGMQTDKSRVADGNRLGYRIAGSELVAGQGGQYVGRSDAIARCVRDRRTARQARD